MDAVFLVSTSELFGIKDCIMLKVLESKLVIFEDSDNPFFGCSATHLELDDDSNGVFIVITQNYRENKEDSIRIELSELDTFIECLHRLRNNSHEIADYQ